MPHNAIQVLQIYVLSVGQADTSVIVTPEDQLVIIDAVRPYKLVDFLEKIGYPPGSEIAELVITHPHDDHYRGANRLVKGYKVLSAVLAPFWCSKGVGSPMYWEMIGELEKKDIPTQFLSGYGRVYPDGALTDPAAGDLSWDKQKMYLELLGAPNSLIQTLDRGKTLDTNHLSVMARLTWGKFSMVFAADAQMENWAHFDQEGMLEKRCQVLKSAHHGSGNGTQWERIYRLDPKCVIVSSDPNAGHQLPDVIGTAVFARMDVQNRSSRPSKAKTVVLTRSTGTIEIHAKRNGSFELHRFQDLPNAEVELTQRLKLEWDTNPTDWESMLTHATDNLYQ